MTDFQLKRVRFMPRQLEPGLLYVSEEFEVAGHLCACGCGNKVITPLGQAEWSFEDEKEGPTLRPSIGSWQLPCKSHYWILAGKVRLAEQWTPEEIEQALYEATDRRWWPLINRYLVTWGQHVCRPVHPRCGDCAIARACPRIGVRTADGVRRRRLDR